MIDMILIWKKKAEALEARAATHHKPFGPEWTQLHTKALLCRRAAENIIEARR